MDDNYIISATLNPDLKYIIENDILRENSIFEINEYIIENNQNEIYIRRKLILYIDIIIYIFLIFSE